MADAAVLEGQQPPAPVRTATRRPSRPLAVTAAVVGVATALPAAYLVVKAFDEGPQRVLDTLASGRATELLVRTALLAGAVTATAVAIAVPIAWLTVRTDLPARKILTVLTALPLVIPSYVGGYAFVAALGPRGVLQSWLAPLGVERLPSIYGFGGAWLVLSLFTYPLVLLPTRSALRGLDPSLEEAARSLGRRPVRVFVGVTLPQLRPAVVSGGLLVALYTLADFGAVSLLRFDTFTRGIYTRLRTFDAAGAATLGLVLVVLMLMVLGFEGRTRGRAAYHRSHASSPRVPTTTRLGAWRWPALVGCVLLVVVALGLPAGVIGYWLSRAIAVGDPIGGTLSLGWHSLQASAVAAATGVLCAWPVALLSSRHPGPFARTIERLSHTGYALPGIVVALTLVFFGVRYVPFAYQTRAMLVFAYVVLFVPQAIGSLRASLLQVPPSLEEASRSLGSGAWRTFRRVVFPMVRPGALTGGALVFLTAMKELPATLLLAPAGFSTLATQVWNSTSAAFFTRAAAPALGLILLSSVPMALLVARDRGR
ncbi:MAG: ABC transporter permease [Actinomycetota bacterium]